MSKELKCGKCGGFLGEIEKGKLRNGSVLLCRECWLKAEAAMNVAEMAREQTPDFLKDLFHGLDKNPFDKEG
jgi:hypothetical protein